ncbi:MAG: hypothetical protein AB7P03_29520 [Kofleriaceae bacterium]
MHRAIYLFAAILLAGCQKQGVGTSTVQAVAGCPDATGVYMASYAHAAEGETSARSGWVLPLHNVTVDSIEGRASYTRLDAAAATAAGVPAPPPSVWLVMPDGSKCKAAIGDYYVAAIDAGAPNLAYGVELSGCPAPGENAPDVAIALAAADEPAGCRAIAPRPVATRLGEVSDDKGWQRPTKQTPIPASFEPVIPAKDCKPPACEMLWSIAQVDVDNRPVAWAGAVNWLHIPPNAAPESQCEWQVDTFAGFFIAGPDGKPVKVTEGQNMPLVLTAVLADQGGAKVLVAEGIGEYTSYDLRDGGAKVGRHLVWLHEHPESYGDIDRIGPDCGM